MKAHFPFWRAMIFMLVLLMLGLPASGAFGAEGDPPVLPTGSDISINHFIGQEGQVSAPINPVDVNRWMPSAAYDYDNGRHLVVWHDSAYTGQDRAVRGQIMEDDSDRYGVNFPISIGSHDRVQPAAAFNGTDDEYLVVFMYDELGTGAKYEIKGQFVNVSGTPVGPEFTIESVAGYSMWSPQVAWNSEWNEYMVVWGSAATGPPPVAAAIGMRILDHNGFSVYGTIISDQGYPSGPAISYDKVSGNYLVVWNFLNIYGQLAVKGDLRDEDGNRIRLVDVFGSETNQGLYPRVTNSLGIFWLVAFEYEYTTTNHDIYITLVSADATGAISAPLVEGATNDTHPDVAGSYDRWEYMIEFQRADVNGSKILMRPWGNVGSDALIDICNFFGTDCSDPAVIYGGGDFISVFLEGIPVSSAAGSEFPTTPVTVQHVFEKIMHTQVLYLPLMIK